MEWAELVLDYIKVLIWPALIAVSAFYFFRSEVRRLFDRITHFKAPGGFEADLRETVAELVKEKVEEQAELAVTADDPAERRRAVDRVRVDATNLGRITGATKPWDWHPELVNYLRRWEAALGNRLRPVEETRALAKVKAEIMADQELGKSIEQTLRRFGPPEALAEKAVEEAEEHRQFIQDERGPYN